MISVSIVGNKLYINIFLPSIDNPKCTLVDRYTSRAGYMQPKWGTPALNHEMFCEMQCNVYSPLSGSFSFHPLAPVSDKVSFQLASSDIPSHKMSG